MNNIPKTNPLRLVAKGGVFSLTGDAINYSLSYVFLLVATHFLGPVYLGVYYFVISLASLLGEFAECGIGQGLMFFGPKLETEKGVDGSLPLLNYALIFTMRNALVLAVILFVLADPIASLFGKPDLASLVRVSSLCIPCAAFWPVLYKYFVARFKIVEGIFYGDILRPVLRVGILLLFIVLGFKSPALIGSEILVGASLIVFGLYLIHKNWGLSFLINKIATLSCAPNPSAATEKPRAQLAAQEKRALFLYSVPFLPLNLTRGDRLILILSAYFLIPAQIGVLGVALKIAALSQVILTGLNFVFRPLVATLYAEGNLAELKAIFKSITRWIFLLTLPLSYIMIFYSSAVLNIFGDNFSDGGLVLVIVALGYLFEYGTSATQVIINMTGKSWLSLFNQICYFILTAVLGIWLIPIYGAVGASLAIAAAMVLINILRLFQTYQIIQTTPYSFYLLKPIAAAAVAGTLSHFISSFLPAIICFLVVYGILIAILRLHPEDWALVQKSGTP